MVHNFDTARKACLLFDASRSDEFRHIREFAGFLSSKGITPYMFGYTPEKEIPDEVAIRDKCDVISVRDLDWLFRPGGESTLKVLEQDFDILFDLSLSPNFPLSWLSELSTASFKVGRYTEEANDYDLMININSNPDIKFFIEQIKNYVSILNKPSKQKD